MKTNIIKTVTGFLPVFNGFYGTIFEPKSPLEVVEEYNKEYGTNYNHKDFTWDYKEYIQRRAGACVRRVEGVLNTLFVNKITFLEYDYTNSSIKVSYELTQRQLRYLMMYLSDAENKREFNAHLYGDNTTNDIDIWLDKYLVETDNKEFGTYLSYALDFYISNETDYNSSNLYWETRDEGYILNQAIS